MKCDSEDNVWCTGPGGIWIIDPSGRHLGILLAGHEHIRNFCFGGPDLTTLFICTLSELGRVEVKVPGPPTPTQHQVAERVENLGAVGETINASARSD